jgi:hypothetical protein
VSWRWEYNPDEDFVIGGATPAFVAQVETAAAELTRAAEVRFLDGSSYSEPGEPIRTHAVEDGLLWYMVVPRDQRLYILRAQAL